MTPEAPRGAHDVFADRLPLAERYVQALATSGVERGLIGPREVERLWSRHVLNCAVVAPALEPGATVVDLGSGAGLPGLPLALARPDLRITLLEPMARRCAWLDEVVADLGVGDSVRVVRGRAEDAPVVSALAGADVVTARAVAPLARLAGWALPLLRDGGTLLAMKGQSAEDEIARDGNAVRALGGGAARVRDYGDGIVDPRTRVVLVTRKESSRAAAGAGRATRRRRRS